MKELVYKLICELDDKRKSENRAPEGVMYNDLSTALLKEMRKELNALQKDGLIKGHPTLNSIIIERLK